MARHHIKDHRAKQLLVVPNDDKFVAVAAPEAFSRHSGTCMILGGQVRCGSGCIITLVFDVYLYAGQIASKCTDGTALSRRRVGSGHRRIPLLQ